MKQYMVCFDIETPDGIVVSARTQREARVKDKSFYRICEHEKGRGRFVEHDIEWRNENGEEVQYESTYYVTYDMLPESVKKRIEGRC